MEEEYDHIKIVPNNFGYQEQLKDLRTQNEVLKERISYLEEELGKQAVFKGATYVRPDGKIVHIAPIYKYDFLKSLLEEEHRRELEYLRKQVKVLKLENRKLLDLLEELCPEAFEE